MKRFSLLDILIGFVGLFGLLLVGIIMFFYMLKEMCINKYKTGMWWPHDSNF